MYAVCTTAAIRYAIVGGLSVTMPPRMIMRPGKFQLDTTRNRPVAGSKRSRGVQVHTHTPLPPTSMLTT